MSPVGPEKKETTEDVKVQTATIEAPVQQQPTIILNPVDAYVHERVKSQPQRLDQISVEVQGNGDPTKHRLSLPKELEQYEKKYAFRWIFKNKKAIDEAIDQRGWVLVNFTLFPDLPKYLFATNGCVERGDNILAFMPLKKAQALRKRPGELSREIIDSTFGKHKGNPNYYVPKDSEDDRVIGL